MPSSFFVRTLFGRRSAELSAAIAGALALTLAGAQAHAATCVGACGVLGANGDVISPPGGGTYGWVSTDGGITGAGQLPGVGGTNGSVFTTSTFHANGGETLSYNFNFISSDGQSAPGQFIYEDYGFVQLVSASTGDQVAMLFNARTEPDTLTSPGQGLPPISPGVTLDPATTTVKLGGGAGGGPDWAPLGADSGTCWGPGCGFTGWINSQYTVAGGGDYKLVFGTSNWGDTAYQTGLAYNGLKIADRPIEDGVPEPQSWVLTILAMGGLGACLRQRRFESKANRIRPTNLNLLQQR